MAPRFKQLLFQIYTDNYHANAFIGFPVNQIEQIYPFRDTLRDEFQKLTGLMQRTNKDGPYEEIDVRIRFFDNNDANMVNAFYSKSGPGCFSWLFRTRSYREYMAEEAKIKPFIKVEISTSHDFPAIEVENSILTEEAIAQLIEKVARDLNLNIVRSTLTQSMAQILMSNRSVDSQEKDV
jgi:hypothetical protein